jgi:hypothetical protein
MDSGANLDLGGATPGVVQAAPLWWAQVVAAFSSANC